MFSCLLWAQTCSILSCVKNKRRDWSFTTRMGVFRKHTEARASIVQQIWRQCYSNGRAANALLTLRVRWQMETAWNDSKPACRTNRERGESSVRPDHHRSPAGMISNVRTSKVNAPPASSERATQVVEVQNSTWKQRKIREVTARVYLAGLRLFNTLARHRRNT